MSEICKVQTPIYHCLCKCDVVEIRIYFIFNHALDRGGGSGGEGEVKWGGVTSSVLVLMK